MKKRSFAKTPVFRNEEGYFMSYDSLTKNFCQNREAYEAAYSQLYSSIGAKHFDIVIKQFNHHNAYPMFFNYTNDIVLLIEQIYKAYGDLLRVMHRVPETVLHQFALQSILEEIKSSNDIVR